MNLPDFSTFTDEECREAFDLVRSRPLGEQAIDRCQTFLADHTAEETCRLGLAGAENDSTFEKQVHLLSRFCEHLSRLKKNDPIEFFAMRLADLPDSLVEKMVLPHACKFSDDELRKLGRLFDQGMDAAAVCRKFIADVGKSYSPPAISHLVAFVEYHRRRHFHEGMRCE